MATSTLNTINNQINNSHNTAISVDHSQQQQQQQSLSLPTDGGNRTNTTYNPTAISSYPQTTSASYVTNYHQTAPSNNTAATIKPLSSRSQSYSIDALVKYNPSKESVAKSTVYSSFNETMPSMVDARNVVHEIGQEITEKSLELNDSVYSFVNNTERSDFLPRNEKRQDNFENSRNISQQMKATISDQKIVPELPERSSLEYLPHSTDKLLNNKTSDYEPAKKQAKLESIYTFDDSTPNKLNFPKKYNKSTISSRETSLKSTKQQSHDSIFNFEDSTPKGNFSVVNKPLEKSLSKRDSNTNDSRYSFEETPSKCNSAVVDYKQLEKQRKIDAIYNFEDESSALVKHGNTPLISNQLNSQTNPTHSPQLPIPSPNYPVQTQVLLNETECSLLVNTSGSRTFYEAHSVHKHVPNTTNVPIIISNNDIINPPQTTSQNNDVNEKKARLDLVQVDEAHSKIERTATTGTKRTLLSDRKRTAVKRKQEKPVEITVKKNDASYQLEKQTNFESLISANQILKSSTEKKVPVQKTVTQNTNCAPNVVNNSIQNTVNINSNPFTVLNIPTLIFPTNANGNKKARLSKIDIATLKRKLRRQQRKESSSSSKTVSTGHNNNTVTSTKYSVNEYGVSVYGYSDSSSSSYESTDCESDDVGGGGIGGKPVDLWIRSGPPSKPNLLPAKVDFLQFFGLTTHSQKNSVELSKLERRRWQPSWCFPQEDNEKVITALDLPVPSQSPSILNHTRDYQQKTCFLHLLGLKTMSSYNRLELDQNWTTVVKNRLKRNSQQSLTKYYLRVNDILSTLNKGERSRLNSVFRNYSDYPASFHNNVHQFYNSTRNIIKNSLPVTSQPSIIPSSVSPFNTVNSQYLPSNIGHSQYLLSTPQLLDDSKTGSNFYSWQPLDTKNVNIIKTTSDSTEMKLFSEREIKIEPNGINVKIEGTTVGPIKWIGVQEIMESYQQYSKERESEISSLRLDTDELKDQIKTKQVEFKHLERRNRELHSSSFILDQEHHKLKNHIDFLTNIINAFR